MRHGHSGLCICAPAAPTRKAANASGRYSPSVLSAGAAELVLLGTGSEVALCVDAAKALAADGKRVRVVSLPNVGLFEQQPQDWRDAVLPASCTARVAVEAGVTAGWWKLVGPQGRIVGIDSFGESAPAGDLFKHFGFTVDNVVGAARDALAGR